MRLTLHNNLPDGQHFIAAEFLKGDDFLKNTMQYYSNVKDLYYVDDYNDERIAALRADWHAMNPQAVKRFKIPTPNGKSHKRFRGSDAKGLKGYEPIYEDTPTPAHLVATFRGFGYEAWGSHGFGNRCGQQGKAIDYKDIFLRGSYPEGGNICRSSEVRMQLPASMGNIGVRAGTTWGQRGRPTTSILSGHRTLERGHRMFTRRMANRPGDKIRAVTVVADLNCPTDTTYWRSLCAIIAAKQLRRAGIQTQLVVLATGWYTACHAHVGWCRVARYDETIDYDRCAALMVHLGWRHSWPWITRAGHVNRGWTARNVSPLELKQLGIMGDEFLIANSNQDDEQSAKDWLENLKF